MTAVVPRCSEAGNRYLHYRVHQGAEGTCKWAGGCPRSYDRSWRPFQPSIRACNPACFSSARGYRTATVMGGINPVLEVGVVPSVG